MKNKLIVTAGAVVLFLSQAFGQPSKDMGGNHPDIHKILVKEVIQTTSYTYIHAEENEVLQWMAVPKMDAEAGETYYYQGGMQMGEFTSKELNRTFSSILFLNGLVNPDLVEGGNSDPHSQVKESSAAEETQEVHIHPAEGGITIAELFSNKQKYANKVVKIRGKVTKYNSQIMKRNWIHLQDGSANKGEYDFTATSAEEANVGEIITIEGMITLDKDFGAGYFYGLIMENGRIVSQ